MTRGPRGLVVSEAFVEYLERLRETWSDVDDVDEENSAASTGSDPEPLTS